MASANFNAKVSAMPMQQTHLGTSRRLHEQRSLLQEVIEAAGHFFLPKFHGELNFIEFFWGMVKKYLRDKLTIATILSFAQSKRPLYK
jgi:hypothetical protein